MARRSDIRYINFYTDGSAARKYELVQPKREEKAAAPKAQRRRRPVIYVDPLALCSIAVSVVMLVLMVAGLAQMVMAHQQEQALKEYVQSLTAKNTQLQEDYAAGYDLEQVEQDALALGMIPVEQAEHITVEVETVEPVQEELSTWDAICAFFASLFA